MHPKCCIEQRHFFLYRLDFLIQTSFVPLSSVLACGSLLLYHAEIHGVHHLEDCNLNTVQTSIEKTEMLKGFLLSSEEKLQNAKYLS